MAPMKNAKIGNMKQVNGFRVIIGKPALIAVFKHSDKVLQH
jgi:hypothetical protein